MHDIVDGQTRNKMRENLQDRHTAPVMNGLCNVAVMRRHCSVSVRVFLLRLRRGLKTRLVDRLQDFAHICVLHLPENPTYPHLYYCHASELAVRH